MTRPDDSMRQLAARLVSLLDLTSLGEDDTPACIEALCARALGAVRPAAVCVYPELVSTAKRALADAAVKVATVVNFPDGGVDAARAARETRRALAAGADEIDLVLPWAAFLRGDLGAARAVVEATRDACAHHTLKLILETGALASAERIRSAAQLGIRAGVDFLKTSTGKVAVNATPEAAKVMLDVIADHGGHCGFKAAGGVRRIEDATVYLDLAGARLGDDWITPAHFRLGASGLLDALEPLLAPVP